MPEWEKLSCRNGLRGERFSSVTHTAHLPTALAILRAGEIRPSLVSDESILKGKGVYVSWFSPNIWHVGYRYGTVSFKFDFSKLVYEKDYHWVEIADYEIPAPRILVGSGDGLGLEPYDPGLGNGPWGIKNAVHSYNSDACLEILMQQSVSLDDLIGIDFVWHHPKYCAANQKTPWVCSELNMSGPTAAGRFLAGVIATELDIWRYQEAIKAGFQHCFFELLRHSDDATFDGRLGRGDGSANEVILDFCRSVYNWHPSEAVKAASAFSSDNEFIFALYKVCQERVSSKYFGEFRPKLEKYFQD